MSRIEDIDNGIWSDPPFEALTPEASLLMIWSWTNPRCGMAGLYKVSRRAMTESKVSLDDLDAALAELAEARMVFYDDDVLFVRARVKRLRTKTPQIAKSIASDLGRISPDHPLRQMFMHEYGATPWLAEGLARLTGPSGDPHGGFTVPTDLSQKQGQSGEGQSTLKGQGKGKGKGREGGAGETFDAAWAAEHVPELPANFVIAAAQVIATTDQPVTAEAVRARVAIRYPAVMATGAAA